MLHWLRLLRVAGLFTLAGNLLAVVVSVMGVSQLRLIGSRIVQVGGDAWLVLACSVQLYFLGMIWNDIIDAERDRVLHPDRPLAGKGGVHPVLAWLLGVLLVSGAIVCASLIGFRGLYACGSVLGLILLYDFGTKRVPWLGSVVMALIRAGHAVFLLLVLGDDFFDRVVVGGMQLLGIEAAAEVGGMLPVYPAILAAYVFGLTLASEIESRRARRWEMLVAGLVMFMSLVAIWVWNAVSGRLSLELSGAELVVPVLLAVLSLVWLWLVGRPWLDAVRSCERGYVGRLTGSCLAGLLLLDAMVAVSFSVGLALLIAGMLLPFMLIARVARMD